MKSRQAKGRILAVDDQPEVAHVVCVALTREGFEVEMASNGREALDFVRRGHPLDLVITDIRMPEMDGLALLRHLRHLRKGLPVVVMTGDPTPHNRLRAREEGASGFISKPFSPKVLQRVVHESLKDTC